jgi:DNA-binding response OmpR family regulator
MSARLLLVEDEPALAVGLVDVLKVKGYAVDHVESGEEGLARGLEGEYALILLDGMLPGISGFEVLERLRGAGRATPVIMLTARGTEMDRVLGFELGVDDYVTKPFSLLELLGRIAAVLRRLPSPPGPAPAEGPSSDGLRLSGAVVDFERFVIRRGASEVSLPARAFDILKVLAAKRGRVLSRDELIDEVWGADESITLRTLNNLIVVIRKAIEPDPEHPRHLKTIHGVGYRLDVE